MFLQPAPTLGEGLRVGIELADLGFSAAANQAMLDRQDDLCDHLQIAVHEHVQGVRDHTLGRVLDRDDAVIRPVLAHLREHIRDGLLRRVMKAGPEPPDRRQVREGGRRPEIGHRHCLLERQRGGHDLAVNGPHGHRRHRPFVQAADPLKHLQLTVWGVNLLAGLQFNRADLERVLGALVQ